MLELLELAAEFGSAGNGRREQRLISAVILGIGFILAVALSLFVIGVIG